MCIICMYASTFEKHTNREMKLQQQSRWRRRDMSVGAARVYIGVMNCNILGRNDAEVDPTSPTYDLVLGKFSLASSSKKSHTSHVCASKYVDCSVFFLVSRIVLLHWGELPKNDRERVSPLSSLLRVYVVPVLFAVTPVAFAVLSPLISTCLHDTAPSFTSALSVGTYFWIFFSAMIHLCFY